jgi:hypothetical protein
MSEKSIKTAAELESIVTTELREHSECDGAGVVVIRPMPKLGRCSSWRRSNAL